MIFFVRIGSTTKKTRKHRTQQKQKTKQLDKLADDIVAKEDKQQKGGK